MNLGMRLEFRQMPVTLTGSIFPQVDEALNETDYQKSLEFVASKKDMDRYRSMVDFLFAEIFIQHRAACFKFYEEDGLQLKDILTPEQTLWYEKALLQGLFIAREIFQRKLALSWTRFRVEVLKRVS
jgi:hypothetical protein